jgi:putative tricarboxylic transport membrane protein
MLAFGAIGYILIKNNFPMPPLILGFVLGPLCETYLRRALMSSDSMLDFFTKPVSGLFLVIALLLVLYTLIKELKATQASQTTFIDKNTNL